MLSKEIQDYLDSLGMFGWKLGLERMRALSRQLGDPQEKFPSIHIAGSNGKGSVARMLEAIFRQAGYRVGLYTSPHLVSPVERIRIDAEDIAPGHFEHTLREIMPVLQEHQATYFEVLTALAFRVFADAGVNLAIIETGLGGRLDATNIISPLCSVITSISHEHTTFLGQSLAEIAREKAGIIKMNSQCVVGDLPAEAQRAIAEICKRRRTKVLWASHVKTGVHRLSQEGTVFSMQWPGAGEVDFRMPLIGAHQVRNAALAVACSRVLSERFPVSLQQAQTALAGVRWPGRFQILRIQPPLVLDVAHNPESMAALVNSLRQVFPDGRFAVIMGVLQDKNAQEMLYTWRQTDVHFFFVTPNISRGQQRELLYKQALQLGLAAETALGPAQALQQAQRRCGDNTVFVVTGSHYVVGEFMRRMGRYLPASELLHPEANAEK